MLDLTALDKVLKEVYIPAVREQMQKSAILLAKVRRDADIVDGTGKYAVLPLMLGYSEGVGARNEHENLPAAKSTRYERVTLPIKTNYGTIEVSGHAIRAAKSDAGAYVRAVDSEMRNMLEGLKRDIARQLYGDGTGRLAAITAITAAPVYGVSDASVFKKTMSVDVYNAAGTTLRGTAEVTAVNETANTITLSAAVAGVVNTDIVVRQGAINKEVTGLAKIVNTDTYLLDPAVVNEWRSTVIAVPTGYSLLAEMQKAYTACEKKNNPPSLILTSFTQRDAYANSLTTARRIVNTIDLEWGFKGLDFNGKAVVADDQAPETRMYFLNTDNLIIPQASDFDWGDEDGKILDKVPNKDAYTAFIYWAANLATDRRNAHAVLTGL